MEMNNGVGRSCGILGHHRLGFEAYSLFSFLVVLAFHTFLPIEPRCGPRQDQHHRR